MWYEIKGWNSFGVFVMIYMFVYIFYTVSSPYLLMFGDDRVLRYT